MFDRYDEIYVIFDNYLLRKINSQNFEIKGTMKLLKNVIKEKYKVDLPIIMDKDRQLIYSAIINYIDIRNQNEMLYKIYHTKRNATINKESESLKKLENQLNIKAKEHIKANMNLENVCQKYTKSICIAMYDGEITLELLQELKEFGYDGSYGCNNLRFAFNLFNSNYNNELRLNEIIKEYQKLILELNKNIEKSQCAELEIEKLKRKNQLLQDEINRVNVLADTYRNRLIQQKVYAKKDFKK